MTSRRESRRTTATGYSSCLPAHTNTNPDASAKPNARRRELGTKTVVGRLIEKKRTVDQTGADGRTSGAAVDEPSKETFRNFEFIC